MGEVICFMCENTNPQKLVELRSKDNYKLYECKECGMLFRYYGKGFYSTVDYDKPVKMFDEEDNTDDIGDEDMGKNNDDESIKIDRFQIVNNTHNYSSLGDICVGIQDYLEYTVICSFETPNRETNMRLAEIVLKELNKGELDLKRIKE